MLPRSPYRSLASPACGVCTDGQGFATRPCSGCGKQKPTPEEITRMKERVEQRRELAATLTNEYFERWKVKFRAQEARRIQAESTDAREAKRSGG